MIPISKAVEDEITVVPFLEEALAQGIVNVSGLARLIRPAIAKKLYKRNISLGSLVMAINRLTPKIKRRVSVPKMFSQMEDITVRSNIMEIIMKNSPEIDHIRREAAKIMLSQRDTFFNFIQGVKESTFVMSKNLEKVITRSVPEKKYAKIDNLSSITISLPPENRKTPGVYYLLLKTLAWNNINLVEVVSNNNELTLIFDDSSIQKAFSLIKSLTETK